MDQESAKTVWVDLATAPDPFFFRPIVNRLQQQGHKCWITARAYGETIPGAAGCGLTFEVVGEHGGRTLAGKASAVLRRGWQLAQLAGGEAVDVAVSFNSYPQALAASRLRIPFVTIMDYEHQPANHLAFRLAHRVIVPEGFEPEALSRQGAPEGRVCFHPGLKEHVSISDFSPDPDFPRRLEDLGIGRSDIIVTMRPPATSSTYHRFQNDFFEHVLLHVAGQPGVKIVALPRYEAQAARIRAMGLQNVVFPSEVLDGLNLVYWSDLVVSAGGSMNREAVVLGTPAWTVFRGRMAGIDKMLIGKGVLRSVQSPEDLRGLQAEKKRANGRRSDQTPLPELRDEARCVEGADGRGPADREPIETILRVILDAARG